MKKIYLLLFLSGLFTFRSFSQLNYYSEAQGKTGDELKAALHSIISGHRTFSYSQCWNLLQTTDEDPENPDNLILIYTGRSQNKLFKDRGDGFDYQSMGYTHSDSWNREHVWPKSHGQFSTDPPAGTDLHHLRPVDRSVNSDRSEKDFDNGGFEHTEAIGCKYDGDSWEVRDEVKGDVARMIFYMAVRYEGDDGTADLEIVDHLTTYPDAEIGRLSTLLQWHKQDPVSDFEQSRNNKIYRFQKNRNPFIDHPEYAEMIWGTAPANTISLTNLSLSPENPAANEGFKISTTVNTRDGSSVLSVKLIYGTALNNMSDELKMTADNNQNYSADIPGFDENRTLFYKIVVTSNTQTFTTMTYTYKFPVLFNGTLTPIYDIQGQSDVSPYKNQEVSMTGIVTGVFGTSFYLQDGEGAWNGIYIYSSPEIPEVGDELIITAKVGEHYNLTEAKDISFFKTISKGNLLPEPVLLPTGTLKTGSAEAEQYESVLVKVQEAESMEELQSYGLWKVDDGSGACLIHNPKEFSFKPKVGTTYNITGIATYTYKEVKIDIRNAEDIQEATDMEAPQISDILAYENEVLVYFNEAVDLASAENKDNYSINNNISVSKATVDEENVKEVHLAVSGMSDGTHTLTVNGVKDLNGNAVENISKTFEYVSTGIEKVKKHKLKVYPNPSNGQFNVFIDSNRFKESTLKIYDANGKLINNSFNVTISENQTCLILNLKHLDKGLYYIQLRSKDAVCSEKIIIQ
ncbi:MAG: hypothetical protein CSA05_00855 [Bacteroidia bacterium]|nr:MAG: hypothetical protein CSA05_00855 [Bacteroidia bacterium]